MRMIVDIEKSRFDNIMIFDFKNEYDDTRIVGKLDDETALRIGQEIIAYYNTCEEEAARLRKIYLNQLETVKTVVNDYIYHGDCRGFFSHINKFSWIDFDFFDESVSFNVGEVYGNVGNRGERYLTEGFQNNIYGSYLEVKDSLVSMSDDEIISNQFADAYVDNDPIKEFIYKPFVPNYVYGMRSRGFSPACQPMDGLVERRDSTDKKYYDLLVYDKPLSEKEIETYQLDYLGLDKEEK